MSKLRMSYMSQNYFTMQVEMHDEIDVFSNSW
jgi:hypothetical protein